MHLASAHFSNLDIVILMTFTHTYEASCALASYPGPPPPPPPPPEGPGYEASCAHEQKALSPAMHMHNAYWAQSMGVTMMTNKNTPFVIL